MGHTHGLAFWGMLITVVTVVVLRDRKIAWKKSEVFTSVILCGVLLQPYISAVVQNITAEQYVINSEELYLVE